MQKLVYSFLFFLLAFSASAQWANTNNAFTDNSHLPASIASNDQTSPITIASPTDSSVIVAWKDTRNGNQDIYAQKFDKNGNALWAANGIAVASGTENQYFYAGGSTYEPQFYSFMATDSAGGFFIAWEDANAAVGSNKNKVCIQHIKADGTLVFGTSGYTVAAPLATDNFYFTKPQLVADGTGGFFISFLKNNTVGQNIQAICYKDINGTLTSYGAANMNDLIGIIFTPTGCGGINNTLVESISNNVTDYQLTYNQQQGCTVVFRMVGTSGTAEYIGTNQLVRVKKNCTATWYQLNNNAGYGLQQSLSYTKDRVVPLYRTIARSQTIGACTSGSTAFYQTLTTIDQYGFDFIKTNSAATNGSIFSFPKVVFLPKNGNITPAIYAWYQKNTANSDAPLMDTICRYEWYDSIPYQLTSDTSFKPNPLPPSNLKKIRVGTDSLMSSGTNGYLYNYQLVASGNNVYMVAKARSFASSATVNSIYLQKLVLQNVTADSCLLKMESPSKQGREVGKDVNTGSQVSSISLNYPGITLNSNGDAMYYVSEYYRYIRVSPVGDSCKLLWGANGKPIGTGYIGTSPYLPQYPTAVFMPNNQRASIFWQENYRTTYTGTGENIMLRNIDSLPNNVLPARRPVSLLTTAPNVATFTLLPQNLLGTSSSYTSFEVINGTGTQQHSLVAEILDNTNLGAVNINVYQHAGTVRQTGGTFYLNRNYSITPVTQPASPVTVRLFFTTEEFNALKLADPLITTVAGLAVTKLNGSTAPASFPGGAAQLIVPEDWQAVVGGYYIQFKVNSFSSFWIHRNTNAALPVTLGSINIACNNNQPTLQFKTLAETNLSHFEVEFYTNNHWQKQCTITAKNASNGYSYQQALNATGLYRLKMVDKDNNYNYSKTVDANCSKQNISLSVYPNPTSNQVSITVTQTGGIIKLYNAQGIMLLQQDTHQLSNAVSLAKYAAGIYTIVYQDKDGNSSKQTIIKQ